MRIVRLVGLSLVCFIAALVVAAVIYTEVQIYRIERAAPPIGEFMQVGDVRLHYVDVAADDPDAPVIVFIHGASGNLRDPLLAFRPGLMRNYRLIFVDRPGHGYSSRGSGDMSDPAAQARVVHGLLANLGIERAVVVGHSLGASVAAAYAVLFRSATAGLVLIAPATHPWPGGVEWYYNVAMWPVIGPIFTHTLVMPVGERLMPGAIRAVFGQTPVPPNYVSAGGIPLVLRPGQFRANAEDVWNLNAHVARMSLRYREISAPTVVIAGGEDTVVRNDIHAEALVREIAGAKLVVFPHAGHSPQFSAPDQVLDLIRETADGARRHGFAELPSRRPLETKIRS